MYLLAWAQIHIPPLEVQYHLLMSKASHLPCKAATEPLHILFALSQTYMGNMHRQSIISLLINMKKKLLRRVKYLKYSTMGDIHSTKYKAVILNDYNNIHG